MSLWARKNLELLVVQFHYESRYTISISFSRESKNLSPIGWLSLNNSYQVWRKYNSYSLKENFKNYITFSFLFLWERILNGIQWNEILSLFIRDEKILHSWRDMILHEETWFFMKRYFSWEMLRQLREQFQHVLLVKIVKIVTVRCRILHTI